MKELIKIILVTLFFSMSIIVPVQAKKMESVPILAVLISNGGNAKVSVANEYEVYDCKRKKIIQKGKKKDIIHIGKKNASLSLQNQSIVGNEIEIRQKGNNPIINLNGKSYRGNLKIKLVGNNIQFINLVKLEDYLKGVVPSEMSESWPKEALKAQAVAARTFSLYTKAEKKHKGYDLCSNTHCQVYSGIRVEAKNVNAAIEATCGEVLEYSGDVIYAAFHSDSGGYTANSEEVWGGKQAYLRSVKDDTRGAPSNKWEETYKKFEVEKILKENGYDIGLLEEITLTPLKLGSGKTRDRYESGRVEYVEFSGKKGKVSLTGNTMRNLFDLRSTLFDIYLTNEKKWKTEHRFKGNEDVIFVGHGWGHGLGLSQWGAKFMAAKNDYRKILSHYYTKIKIKKIY